METFGLLDDGWDFIFLGCDKWAAVSWHKKSEEVFILVAIS